MSARQAVGAGRWLRSRNVGGIILPLMISVKYVLVSLVFSNIFNRRLARAAGGVEFSALLFACSAFLFVVLIGENACAAPNYPQLTGRVVDAANILTPQAIQAATQKLDDLEKKTGAQAVIVTVPSLEGEDINVYANDLFHKWALGDKTHDNGVLFVVAPNEPAGRRLRIEVGYGLEGTLTDALSSVILNTNVGPKFKKGDPSGAVISWVDSVTAVLTADPADFHPKTNVRRDKSESLFDQLLPFLVFGLLIFILYKMARGGRRSRFGGPMIFPLPGPFSGGGWGGGFGGDGGGGFFGGGGDSGGGGATGGW